MKKHALGKKDGGYGVITAKGYRRVYDPKQKRYRMEHVLVWESYNGPVPLGYQVHHDDEDKLNNEPWNLKLLSTTAHKRLHGGCVWQNGEWWKPCKDCGAKKPVNREHWYMTKEGWPLYRRCRPCHIRHVVKWKQNRKASTR